MDCFLPDPKLRNDERVLRILKFYDRPLPVSTLAVLTGLDPAHCKRVIDSLVKFGKAKLRTVCRTGYYEAGDIDD